MRNRGVRRPSSVSRRVDAAEGPSGRPSGSIRLCRHSRIRERAPRSAQLTVSTSCSLAGLAVIGNCWFRWAGYTRVTTGVCHLMLLSWTVTEHAARPLPYAPPYSLSLSSAAPSEVSWKPCEYPNRGTVSARGQVPGLRRTSTEGWTWGAHRSAGPGGDRTRQEGGVGVMKDTARLRPEGQEGLGGLGPQGTGHGDSGG